MSEKINLQFMDLLYLRFTNFFGDKFTKNHPTDDFVNIWKKDWIKGLSGIEIKFVKPALDKCMFMEWPPSLGEFRTFCEEASGLPTLEEVYNSALRTNFSHPIIEIIYNQVGSWNMRHDTEKELREKFKSLYPKAVHELRMSSINKEKLIEFEGHKTIEDSHGREISGDYARGNGVRKIKEDLFP